MGLEHLEQLGWLLILEQTQPQTEPREVSPGAGPVRNEHSCIPAHAGASKKEAAVRRCFGALLSCAAPAVSGNSLPTPTARNPPPEMGASGSAGPSEEGCQKGPCRK